MFLTATKSVIVMTLDSRNQIHKIFKYSKQGVNFILLKRRLELDAKIEVAIKGRFRKTTAKI